MLLAAWVFPARVIDQDRSLQGPVKQFVRSIPPDVWARTRGWNLSETMRGYFYVYEGLDVVDCSDAREAEDILEGRNARYRYIVYTSRPIPRLPEGLRWKRVAEGGESDRRLTMITGADAGPDEPGGGR